MIVLHVAPVTVAAGFLSVMAPSCAACHASTRSAGRGGGAARRNRSTWGSDLPPLRLHGLRHSCATAALEAGERLRAVADHLGHADTAVTDRTYRHTVRSVQDVTALRVAGLIAGKRGKGG